jgi:hypothetical protein
MRFRLAAVAVCSAGFLCAWQGPIEPEGLLARIQRKIDENLERMPNYTCVETMERFSRQRDAREFQPIDRLNLEVAESGGKELFARAGAQRFEEKHPSEFAAWGAVGNGEFSGYERSVFLSGRADFHYAGREECEGRTAIRYDYAVSAADSGFRVVHFDKSAIVPFHGSFWADPDSLDLIRLDVIADRIPRELDMDVLSTQLDYARFHIGEADFLLAQSSAMLLTHFTGLAQRNRTEFTHCRQYAGSATISFDDKPALGEPSSPSELVIPPDIRIHIDLSKSIALQTARVGDALLGSVTAAVVANGRRIIPAGAEVIGRLRGIRQSEKGAVITLEFSEIRFSGGNVRFFAEMERVRLRRGSAKMLESSGLPGVAVVSVAHTSVLPEHALQMTWKTVRIGDP